MKSIDNGSVPDAVSRAPDVSADVSVQDPRTAFQLLLQWTGGEPVTVPTTHLHRREQKLRTLTTLADYDALVASESKGVVEIVQGFLTSRCNCAIRDVLSAASQPADK